MNLTNLSRIASPAALLIGAVLVGCSNPQEDVRLTLCKGVTEVLLESPQAIDWKGHDNKMGRFVDLEMTVEFATKAEADGTRPMQAVCFFEYQEPTEDNVITDTQPLSLYSTSPYKIILNGETVSGTPLNEAILAAMVNQGKEFAALVRKGTKDAVQTIKEELETGETK